MANYQKKNNLRTKLCYIGNSGHFFSTNNHFRPRTCILFTPVCRQLCYVA